MSYSRHRLRPNDIDRCYPYQVALSADDVRGRFETVKFLSDKLGCSVLGHSYFAFDEHYNVYCFAEDRSAECFLKAMDGDWITPQERKKGTWRPRHPRNLVGRQPLQQEL